MATTTNYGWSTPDDTALVSQGAAAIRTLGSSVDTTVKALSPGTTAGDVDYYTSSTAKARLGIGSTGQVLTVAAGVPSWAAVPSSAPASATATVATSQTTTSTSYTDLATAGPAVTITTGTKALVIITCQISDNTVNRTTQVDFAVSGATTRAASDTTALVFQQESGAANRTFRGSAATILTVTSGSNTFTAKYKSSGSTSTFANREIIVINLG